MRVPSYAKGGAADEDTRSTKQQIIEQLDQLSREQLDEVLSFVNALGKGKLPRGISGKELADFFRGFSVTKEEAEAMTRILEEMKNER